MAPLANLEDRFNATVKAIQTLPANGPIQLNNLTKLIFYGLYKQATAGPCKDSKPSMFNYINRAKWEAWDRCRSMTKEQAMAEYIDELRKTIETLPKTKEILEFAESIGLSNRPIDEQPKENNSTTTEDIQQQTIVTETKENRFESFASDINEDGHHQIPLINPNPPTRIVASASNDQLLTSSSISSSSISSSDIDEFYDDPSDLLILNYDEIVSDNNYASPDNSINIPIRNSNSSSIRATTLRHHNPTNNYNKETQRAILTALTKLQRDINNILDRLNRLETSANLLQQRELLASLEAKASSRWLPLSGFRRGAIAFVLLWPFVAFLLIRLFLRARIIIRFRRQRL